MSVPSMVTYMNTGVLDIHRTHVRIMAMMDTHVEDLIGIAGMALENRKDPVNQTCAVLVVFMGRLGCAGIVVIQNETTEVGAVVHQVEADKVRVVPMLLEVAPGRSRTGQVVVDMEAQIADQIAARLAHAARAAVHRGFVATVRPLLAGEVGRVDPPGSDTDRAVLRGCSPAAAHLVANKTPSAGPADVEGLARVQVRIAEDLVIASAVPRVIKIEVVARKDEMAMARLG